MPVVAGWLTGEQVPLETIDQTITTMEHVLCQYNGTPARIVQPGMGLVTISHSEHVMQHNDEPPVLDWVPDRRTFVYRRPLSGAHALYYIENWPAQGNLLFASELKALLALGVPRELRFAALNALLRFGFIPAPWTAFKHLFVVPAGSMLRWQHAKTIVNHAADFRFDTASNASLIRSQQDTIEHLKTLLRENTNALLPPHSHLVALTDGRIASVLSAFIASQITTTPFTIASFGYKNSHSKEWQHVQQVAVACHRPLLTIVGVDQPEFWLATLAGLESPCADTRPLALHQLLHAVATETGARVAFSGLGASTIFGSRVVPLNEILNIFSHDAQQKIQQEERWEDSLHARKLQRRADQFDKKQHQQYYLDLHIHMPDSIVHSAHQLAMQEGIAIRSPYLRSDVMDALTPLNTEIRNETLLPLLVAHHFPVLKNVQTTLPLEMPTPSLLRVKDSDLLKETLSREAIQATGIFDPHNVEELLWQKKISRELVLVFTTQLFCRLFSVETN